MDLSVKFHAAGQTLILEAASGRGKDGYIQTKIVTVACDWLLVAKLAGWEFEENSHEALFCRAPMVAL